MPLTPLPLASQSHELVSRAGSAHRLLNLHAEKLPEGSRSGFILKPTPGLEAFQTVGAGPIYALTTLPGLLYVASGTRVYRIYGSGLPTEDIGDVGPASAATTIAVGDNQVVVCNPPNVFVGLHTGVLAQVMPGTGAFPAPGASSVSYIDGYFVFTSYEGTFFFVSSLKDGATFDALDYAESERRPDIVQYSTYFNGELWLFGLNNMSVWYNAGTADFPFRERLGSSQPHGLGSLRTLCELDGSLFYLGNDRVVYRTKGYQVQRISTHAIEELLTRYEFLRDITACSFMFEGHAFFAMRMPTAVDGGHTFVYDCATQVWHERSSSSDPRGCWKVDRAVQFGVLVLMGDATTGTLYRIDSRYTTDAGAPISRLAVLPPVVTHGPRGFMSRLEVEMDVGTAEAPGSVLLDWSDDGGRTYTAARTLSTGATGATRTRVATTRLGSFRQRVLRLRSENRMTVYAVDADITKGAG